MRAFSRSRVLLGFVAVSATLAVTPVGVHADGGGGTTTYTPGRTEDTDYTAAAKAIKANDFASAIRLLQGVVARDARNADAYNWLGYATRRNGDAAAAIPLYQKALALDPKHRGAHEYIGEAYLLLDDPAKAKQHLTTLNALCFLPCSEYSDLKKAVEAYEKSGGKVKPTAAN
jgi:tetratricopeptide (TPR) repeat protein